MNTKISLTLAALGLAACLQPALAQLNIPSDGSDGVFAPTEDTVIDLSQAVIGRWNDNNSANAGEGIYDKDKWAIVFKSAAVNIPGIRDEEGNLTGVRVTFKNHPSRAPVVWLVRGDVVVGGIVSLDGSPGQPPPSNLIPSEPGPGGFRGGVFGPQGGGSGLGPGGALRAQYLGNYAEGYRNPQILPLIGGSGSGAGQVDPRSTGWSASGVGGAILIAAVGEVRVDGLLSAKGGDNADV